ncbi:MAG TPA: carboxypeptidase regulatory-like domain-containing protein [Verrucomicrobiae bacterium]
MRMNPRFLIVPALVAGLQAAVAGDVTGTITLSGTPPPEKVNEALSSNPDCGKLHSEPVKTQFYVVDGKNDLADVVVTVKGMAGKSTGETAAPLVLDQKGCEYIPYIAAVQTKQKIVVKNSDPLFHNVDVVPGAAGNSSSAKNQAQGPGAPDFAMSFPAEESFLRFKCDVHPWMFAYVTVVDSPYFSVSKKDGTYKISNLPPGKYTIEAAHRKAGKVSKEVEVKDGSTTLDFTMEVPK